MKASEPRQRDAMYRDKGLGSRRRKDEQQVKKKVKRAAGAGQ